MVMPGLSAHQLGDTVRFGANDCREDEEDQSKVHFLPQLYRVCERGFLSQAGEVLTAREKEVLRWGAKLMTLECGMRFLTDYLQGDVELKIARPDQTLDRAEPSSPWCSRWRPAGTSWRRRRQTVKEGSFPSFSCPAKRKKGAFHFSEIRV